METVVLIEAIRQTRATLALENLELSEIANKNLQKMAGGEMSREEYQTDLKKDMRITSPIDI